MPLDRLSRTRRYHVPSLELECFLTTTNKLVESDDWHSVIEYFDDDGYYKGPDQYGVEPIFTDDSICISDMAIMLIAAGELFAGEKPEEEAEYWVECGFVAKTAWEWVQIECWSPFVARQWRDAGLTPDDVAAAAADMVNGCSEPDLQWTDSCPINSCCYDDTDPQDLIDHHRSMNE